ncbi:hypothetical protein GCM10009415_18570 [Chitinophaga japonensis]
MVLDWEHALEKKNPELVVVPVIWNSNLLTGGLSTRKLVILKDSLQRREGLIIQVIPNSDYYKENGARFFAGSFNGSLIELDLNLQYRDGAYYVDGQRKYPAKLDHYPSREAYEHSPKTEGCTYSSTAYYSAGVVTVVGTSVCSSTYFGGGGGGGTGKGADRHPWEDFIDEGDFPSEGGSDPTPYIPNSVTDIKNHLTTPCFKTTVTDLIYKAGAQSAISQIIWGMFSASDKVNLSIYEEELRPSEDGVTSGGQSGGYVNIDITLNSTGLANASKEYIAVTMLHECLHAYFNVKNKWPLEDANYVQHQAMAGMYVEVMADALQQTYPTISRSDAIDLAWGGLDKSLAWKNIVTSNPSEANRILLKNQAYKNGSSGTKCN